MSSNTSKLSKAVVVPTYERPDKLFGTVESICNQTLSDFEVVVVDDGSKSEEQRSALSEIESSYSQVRVIRQKNRGPAAARNRGWKTTGADIILFTDDDCLVPTNWIERLPQNSSHTRFFPAISLT